MAAKKRFTFAMAKEKIAELEDQLAKAIDIIDNQDNILSNDEVKKVKRLEIWAVLGPSLGLILGLVLASL